MANRRKLLRDLLLTLFRSNDDLYEAIDSLDYAQMPMLLAGLPGPAASRIAFTLTAVEQLEAHGLTGAALFDTLAARFPARDALIGSVRRAWGGGGEEGELAQPTSGAGGASGLRHGASTEILDGDHLAEPRAVTVTGLKSDEVCVIVFVVLGRRQRVA